MSKKPSGNSSKFTWDKPQSGAKPQKPVSGGVKHRLDRQTSVKPSDSKMTNEITEHKKKFFKD